MRGYYVPPFTRVHNIFRIRTVVNAVTSSNKKRLFPNDKEIAKVLAKSGLSKFRREKIKDRIMRRARDHLLTSTYMGLLTRKERPFKYSSSTIGKLLSKYHRDSECPNDVLEETIFIDRLMRLKITNVFDLQSGTQYLNYRSRPCLYILYLLKKLGSLHEHHLALGTGNSRSDPVLLGDKEKETLRKLTKFKKLSLSKFYSYFQIKKIDRKNLTRNIMPLLDWLISTGLIERKNHPSTEVYYRISQRGIDILDFYSKKTPIWYLDFKELKQVKSALLLFYSYISKFDISIQKSFLDTDLQVGLKKLSIKQILKMITKETKTKFKKDYSNLEKEIDFSFEYDIPPKDQANCLEYLKQIFKIMHLKLEISKLDLLNLKKTEKIVQESYEIIKENAKQGFSQSTSLTTKSILHKVKKMIPTGGVLNQYSSDFEKETSILLRLLEFNAMKYQGQFAERTHKKHVAAFFENNPDILISNGIEVLVECKSIGEWKMPIRNVKTIPKEMLIYQHYLPEVRSCSTAIVYEGSLDDKSFDMIKSILDDTTQIVFVTKNFLINSIQKPQQKKRLIQTIRAPKKYKSQDKILN